MNDEQVTIEFKSGLIAIKVSKNVYNVLDWYSKGHRGRFTNDKDSGFIINRGSLYEVVDQHLPGTVADAILNTAVAQMDYCLITYDR